MDGRAGGVQAISQQPGVHASFCSHQPPLPGLSATLGQVQGSTNSSWREGGTRQAGLGLKPDSTTLSGMASDKWSRASRWVYRYLPGRVSASTERVNVGSAGPVPGPPYVSSGGSHFRFLLTPFPQPLQPPAFPVQPGTPEGAIPPAHAFTPGLALPVCRTPLQGRVHVPWHPADPRSWLPLGSQRGAPGLPCPR